MSSSKPRAAVATIARGFAFIDRVATADVLVLEGGGLDAGTREALAALLPAAAVRLASLEALPLVDAALVVRGARVLVATHGPLLAWAAALEPGGAIVEVQ